MKFPKPMDVRQFGNIRVVCHPTVMQQMLDILADLFRTQAGDARHDKYEVGSCWMFKSGARLVYVGDSKYNIYCYHYAGHDGLSAVEELKMAYALRQAEKAYDKLNKINGSGPIDSKSAALAHKVEWRPVCQ